MIILDVNKLNKNFGFGSLFENVSFSLNEGESISIVGPNGCGKSTLLKIIAGEQKADSGTISIKKDATVGYLDQTGADRKDERKVLEVLRSSFENLTAMQERISKYEERLSHEPENQELLNKYCKTIEEYSNAGGYDVGYQIDIVCNGLGIKSELLDREYNSLSGGEKTLIRLARVLLLKPELLLLDEPTNHLDIKRIEWLEEYIKSFKGATVIVSHDRYFLDKMSNKILDMSGLVAKVYNTNYSGFLVERETEFKKQMDNYKDQQIVIKRLKEQIKYFAERGMATNSSTMCNRAHALNSQLQRILKNKIERPQEERKYNIEFMQEKKASKRVIEAKGLTVTTPEGKNILKDVNLIVSSRERLALIGDNGSGKSTFIKTILGLSGGLEVKGGCVVGPSTIVGYLPQIIDFENEKQTLLEYFKEQISQGEEYSRRVLSSFGFGFEETKKIVNNLSGGERIRVRLAILLEQKVNCLIFDEPTNHIDINTKETLEEAINRFNGTFIFVSHDRYFINKFAEKIVEFANSNIKVYHGNYDDYKRSKQIRTDL